MPKIQDLSDEQIEEILRGAQNTNTSGSQYQQAWNEWQIRSHKKLLDEQGKGNASLVKSTRLLAYATIALAVITAIIGYIRS